MDSIRPQHVSVIDPISPAIEHVKLMLFRPFDLGKWFIVGFCAWLAYLGQGGGGGTNFNFNFPSGRHQSNQFGCGIAEAKEAIVQALPFIIIVAAIAIPLGIIIGLVLCWLRSRGLFMFLHCVAGNKAEVKVPWGKFSRHGNSLFLFKIVVGLIGLVVVGLPIVLAIVMIIALASSGAGVAAVSGLVIAFFAVVVLSISFGLVGKFTDDFVVPIMSLHTESCMAGWKHFWALLGCNKARFTLYILFQIAISFVILAMVSFICLIGCCLCCSSILLFLPYIGTVILLPLFVFKRAYSLLYLRQYGQEFDVFIPEVT